MDKGPGPTGGGLILSYEPRDAGTVHDTGPVEGPDPDLDLGEHEQHTGNRDMAEERGRACLSSSHSVQTGMLSAPAVRHLHGKVLPSGSIVAHPPEEPQPTKCNIDDDGAVASASHTSAGRGRFEVNGESTEMSEEECAAERIASGKRTVNNVLKGLMAFDLMPEDEEPTDDHASATVRLPSRACMGRLFGKMSGLDWSAGAKKVVRVPIRLDETLQEKLSRNTSPSIRKMFELSLEVKMCI
jgi:hypothetical protein